MNEENATNFDEFFGSFDADDGYQTDSGTNDGESGENQQEDKSESAEEEKETSGEAAEADEKGENAENVQGDGKEKSGAEHEQTSDTFTIKVNKEERQVTMEELISLAQKGADYDRVKKQAENGNQALMDKLSKTQQVYDVISMIAKESGVEVPVLLDTFRVRQLMEKDGLSEKEAQERLGRLKAEEKLNAIQSENAEKSSPDKQMRERAERELKEFRKNFPDVDISDLPVEKMAEDIASGMTMTQAYLKELNRRQSEEIRTLNEKLKAKEQNDRNRISSPGSASDSGTKKAKDKFEDFFSAFG